MYEFMGDHLPERDLPEKIGTSHAVEVDGKSYEVVVEADGDGFCGHVPILQGCLTDGDTVKAVLENIGDAIRGWLEAKDAIEA